ncbi:MAG: CDP-alcohol phosphatidyltransferase family protein [Acidobacteriota bacterium]|nr:CDP-alcohol phosphatidyltransferase family protein [Acidobacteriota bacterium]
MNFTIPNLLSLLRMGLVPPFIIAVLDGQPKRALVIFLLAGISDALDGAIARFFHQQSALGAYLDPIADKLLLTSAYVSLAIPGLNHGAQIPAWVSVLVIARDVVIVIVVAVLYLALEIRTFQPSVLSKITTVFQVAAVLLVLVSGLEPSLEPLTLGCLYAVAVLTLASGLDYLYRANKVMGTLAAHKR